jgi:hypothetical protein
MARYDKYDPISGGFRAPLAADFTTAGNFGKVYAVGINASGQVVIGAGQTGIVGVMVLSSARYAGDVVDVMTQGEIVDLNLTTPFDNFAAAPVAGTTYYGVTADGTINTTATANKRIGWTVESKRLVVRIGNGAAGG